MNRRMIVFFSFVATTGALFLQQRLGPQAEPSAKTIATGLRSSWDYYPGRLIVKFNSEIKNTAIDARARALLQEYHATSLHPLLTHARDRVTAAQDHIGLSRIMILNVPPQTDVEALAAQVQKNPIVEYAEPDYLIPLDGFPNDSLFSRQQYLPQIKAPAAWDIARGDSSVVIAIIDSGTDWQHPDLAANIWKNEDEIIDGIDNDDNGFIDDVRGWDFVDQPLNPFPGEDAATPDNDPMDFAGHGTGVAGVAAAATNNGRGIAALSWNVKIMPLRVGWLRIDGLSLVDVAWTAAAFVYAADNGAHLVNLSAASTRIVADAAAYAFQKGVVVTSAAGNAGNQEASGLNLAPFAITVAAIDDQDRFASYTSYGDWVKVCAPGGDMKRQRPGILTTFLNHGYEELQGTSFAAPLAASLAALVKSQHPDWSPAQITFQLVETADNVDAFNPDFVQGKLGRGRINAERALTESITAAPRISLVKILPNSATSDGVWDAGETVQFAVELRNDWGDANNLLAEISSDDHAVRLVKATADYGTLPGLSDLSVQHKSNINDPFVVEAITASLPHRVRFKLNLQAAGGYQQSFDFYLAITPSVLLVDDDDGKNNVEGFYTGILDSLGLGFETFTHARGELEPLVLSKYATVIWACEWAFPSLNENDRAALQEYLRAGGNLFLSGQDIGWDLCDPAPGFLNELNRSGGASKAFFEQALHARYVSDDANTSQVSGIDGDPISDGLQFKIQQPGRTVSEQLPSEILPLANAFSIFKYPNGQTGAVRYAGDYRLVYFAFGGYEAIVPKPQRDALMPRVLNWLNGFHLQHAPLRDTDDTTAARPLKVRIISEISSPQRVELHWDTDGHLPFNKVAMQSAGNGEYTGDIPPQFKKNVEYFFFVSTTRGFAAPLQKYSYATFPDTIPPVLESLTQVPNTMNADGPYAVNVQAYDLNGIDTNNVSIHFRTSSGQNRSTFMRPRASPPGRFEGSITGGWSYGDTVYYRASATDLALARNRTDTPERFFVIGLNDFEDGFLREWVADSSGAPLSAWGLSSARRYAGRYAANSNPGRVYPLDYRATLTSAVPANFSSGSVLLTFFEQHVFEEDQEDFGVVEISRDSLGQNWTALGVPVRGIQTHWQQRDYFIAPQPGSNYARFRFRVQTDANPNPPRPGWFIDEVRLLPASIISVGERQTSTPMPTAFALAQNYPNPFSLSTATAGLTAIRIDLPVPAEIDLSIYDLLGRRVVTMMQEKRHAGIHALHWDGADENGLRVAAGIYLCRLQAIADDGKDVFRAVRKLVVMP
ncbi:MAG: S8 family serine peptidase [bacterium]